MSVYRGGGGWFLRRQHTIWLALAVAGLIPSQALPAAAAEVVTLDFEDPGFWTGLRDVRSDDELADPVDGYRGSGLGVTVPAGGHRGLGAIQPVPGHPSEAWFRYMLRLDGFDPSQAGKFPGLAGLSSASARGCIAPTGDQPGWSARLAYRPTGTYGAGVGEVRVGYYLYHLDQPSTCGEILLWEPGILTNGAWYCIEGHVRLNQLGRADGFVEGWLDGRQAFARDGLRFRSSPVEAIEQMWLNVYSGGQAASPETLGVTLDEVVVSAARRIGCPDAFADDEADPNEDALNLLSQLGVLQGCAQYLACPTRAVTRGELAALLDRALDLPAGATTFTDLSGHLYQPGIGRVVAAGLMAGCNSQTFCPDQTITRGEAAVALQLGFDLPLSGDNLFSDDDGTVVDAASNALGAAEITAGCGLGRFCPDAALDRSQTAALFARLLSQIPAAMVFTGPLTRPEPIPTLSLPPGVQASGR